MHETIHVYFTCYDTWLTLLFLWSPRSARGRRASSFPRRNTWYVYYLHAPRQITGGTDHDPTPASVMMRERISVEVARVVTNFLTVVSAARTRRVGAGARMCMRVCACEGSRGFATTRACNLCSGQRQRSVWENITAGSRMKPKERGKERTINRKRSRRKTFSTRRTCNCGPKLCSVVIEK